MCGGKTENNVYAYMYNYVHIHIHLVTDVINKIKSQNNRYSKLLISVQYSLKFLSN